MRNILPLINAIWRMKLCPLHLLIIIIKNELTRYNKFDKSSYENFHITKYDGCSLFFLMANIIASVHFEEISFTLCWWVLKEKIKENFIYSLLCDDERKKINKL